MAKTGQRNIFSFDPKTGNSPSAPNPPIEENLDIAPIEENLDIEGKWVGTFGGKPATFVFSRTEDKNKFLGTLTRPPFEIAIAAEVGLDARQVIFDEKSVIRGKGWDIGNEPGFYLNGW